MISVASPALVVKLRERLALEYPEASARLLPTHYMRVAELSPDPEIEAAFGRIVRRTDASGTSTVQAIVGSGNRGGVDMVWGTAPAYGHFGIDLTGPTGGVVRIDDIEVEDVTNVFLRDMLGMVDVRDFGAKGDGVTDDTAAFAAAEVASIDQNRRELAGIGQFLVPVVALRGGRNAPVVTQIVPVGRVQGLSLDQVKVAVGLGTVNQRRLIAKSLQNVRFG